MANAIGEQLDVDKLRLILAISNLDRIGILGILATRELTTEELVSETDLAADAVGEHIALLGRAGLITARKDGHHRLLSLRREALSNLEAWSRDRLAAILAAEESAEDIPLSVRQFFRGRRLESFPARQGRKLEVLAFLVQDFERGREYAEAEVNQILLMRHPDFATLRRALIDEGLMTRREGVYRRVR